MPETRTCFCRLSREVAARVVARLAEQPPHLVERVVQDLGVMAACPGSRVELAVRVLALRLGLTPSVPNSPATLH